MKSFIRLFTVGIFAIGLVVTASQVTFAQADFEKRQALYDKYLANYEGNEGCNRDVACISRSVEKKQIALNAAKEYVQKFSADNDAVVSYLRDNVPILEDEIKHHRAEIVEARAWHEKQGRYKKFNDSYKAGNFSATYDVGAEILNYEPEMLDVALVLGSIGFDEARKNPANDRYNDRTIKFAKLAIEKMNSGIQSPSKKYGAFDVYQYGTKEEASAWMNYHIGMILYHRQGKDDPIKRKLSLNYLYNSTQFKSELKNDPTIYGSIGDWYFVKAGEIGSIRERIPTDDETRFDEIDRYVAQERAYADRALDAYARALRVAQANPKSTASYKDGLTKTINTLFDFRYLEPEEKTPIKINGFIAGVMSKPMPHPASAVKPVVTEKPEAEGDAAKTDTDGTARSRTVSTTDNR